MNILEVQAQPRLQIVKKREDAKPRVPIQVALFPSANKLQLIFVSLPGMADQDFLSIVSASRPSVVVDLRRAARFNIGRLNRRDALRCFEENQSLYLDSMAISERWSQDDCDPDLGALFAAIDRAVPNLMSGRQGPVLFLIAQTDRQSDFVMSIAAEWRRHTPADWDVCQVL